MIDTDVLRRSCVGIAGLGGMGSNTAVMLARSDIGKLVIADFDRVDETNIARQAYLPRHIGMPKCEALAGILREIVPHIELDVRDVRLDPTNIRDVFAGCDVVCEAMDDPGQKAMFIETVLEELPDVKVVGCSGMAGYGPSNDIVTRRAMNRYYVCGDGVSDVRDGMPLNAARVSVCAGHMASAVLRLLLGEEP